MRRIKTDVICVVCKSREIIAEVEQIDPPFSMSMEVGGESEGSRTEIRFHCSNPECQIMYNYPPGKPRFKSEILRKLC
jgi:hypothetical protein